MTASVRSTNALWAAWLQMGRTADLTHARHAQQGRVEAARRVQVAQKMATHTTNRSITHL